MSYGEKWIAPTYKKMISGKDVYSFPSNLDDAIEYSPLTLHEEN